MTYTGFPQGPITGDPVFIAMDVSPELAAQALADRMPNRHVSPRRVNAWTRDMEAGNYHLNHQGVAFTWHEGRWRLNDGQHRFAAVVKVGRAVRMVVAFGADTRGVDLGRQRVYSDQLSIDGMTQSTQLSAIARLVTIQLATGEPPMKGAKFTPTWDELNKTLEDHPCIGAFVPLVDRIRRAIGLRASIGGWLRFMTAHSAGRMCESPDDDWFLSRLIEGDGLTAGHPALTLRNRVVADRDFRRDELRLAAGCVYAWNAYRDSRELAIIKVPGSLTAATFPEVR